MESTALCSCRTRALLAVSHVGSTALRVTVPAVTTCGKMAPYCPSSSKPSCLMKEQREGQMTSDIFTQIKKTIEDTINKPSDSARQFCLTEPYHLLGAAKTDKIRDLDQISSVSTIYTFKRLSNLMRF